MSATVYTSLAVIIIAYLLGSIPSGYIMGKLRRGIDIRQMGSHNMGAMNVLRVVGPVEAFIVLVADAAKGIGVILIARALGLPEYVVIIAAAVVIIGHIFTVFLRFHGGKGGATGMAVLLFLMPWSMPFYGVITGMCFALTRNLTLAYGAAFLVFPFVAWLIYHSVPLIVFSLVIIAALAVQNLSTIITARRKGVRQAMKTRTTTVYTGKKKP
jgi:acyl phosphate:glycerol-3-phosphate acyltransferase